MHFPEHLQKLIENLKKLPGVGSRSAERFAFELLTWEPAHLHQLSTLVSELPIKLQNCTECGCLREALLCTFCKEERHHGKTLCILASPRDAFAIESTQEYRGLYHVLDGLLSPLEGRGPEVLALPRLIQRIERHGIEEIILALDSSIEGDATSLYLKKHLAPLNIRISRLAFGIPMGSSIDYVDGGTLARAFLGRGHF